MPHSYTQLYYHLVFSTKDRQPWLTREIRDRLYPFLGGGIRDEGGTALAINGIDDHVHILARENQEEHHKRMTFKEEFVALLKAHGIEFDEKYLWD